MPGAEALAVVVRRLTEGATLVGATSVRAAVGSTVLRGVVAAAEVRATEVPVAARTAGWVEPGALTEWPEAGGVAAGTGEDESGAADERSAGMDGARSCGAARRKTVPDSGSVEVTRPWSAPARPMPTASNVVPATAAVAPHAASTRTTPM